MFSVFKRRPLKCRNSNADGINGRHNNAEHYQSGLGLLIPEMVHYGKADKVVERRKSILLRAY